jgi:hypothetical protein
VYQTINWVFICFEQNLDDRDKCSDATVEVEHRHIKHVCYINFLADKAKLIEFLLFAQIVL